jgi:hypothetical protein
MDSRFLLARWSMILGDEDARSFVIVPAVGWILQGQMLDLGTLARIRSTFQIVREHKPLDATVIQNVSEIAGDQPIVNGTNAAPIWGTA